MRKRTDGFTRRRSTWISLPVLMFLLLGCAGLAQEAPQPVHRFAVAGSDDRPQPARREGFLDPRFGKTVTRITGTSWHKIGIRPVARQNGSTKTWFQFGTLDTRIGYVIPSAWNSNGQRLLLDNHHRANTGPESRSY